MWAGVFGGALGVLSAPLLGHRLQATTTQIEYRLERRALEVVHSIHLDDGVFLLRALQAGTGAQALSVAQRAKLLYYVEQHFVLQVVGGQRDSGSQSEGAEPLAGQSSNRAPAPAPGPFHAPLTLDPVGAQFDGETLWIYQELSLPTAPLALDVRCALLHDLFPAARNHINYRLGNTIKTLNLSVDLPQGRLQV